MKIVEISEKGIKFDNGMYVTYKVESLFGVEDNVEFYFDFLSLRKEAYMYDYNKFSFWYEWAHSKIEDSELEDFKRIGLHLNKDINRDDQFVRRIDYKPEEFIHFSIPLYRKMKKNIQLEILKEYKIHLVDENDHVLLTLNGDESIELVNNYYRSNDEVEYDKNAVFKIWNEVDGETINFTNKKELKIDCYSEIEEYRYSVAFTRIDHIDDSEDVVLYENELVFEPINNGSGFRFGNRGGEMISYQCYWHGNPWSHHQYELNSCDVYYDNKLVLHLDNVPKGRILL